MLDVLAGNVDHDAPDRLADFSVRTASLHLTPVVEDEMDDDRRAALAGATDAYDPEGLYKIEIERDTATEYLADNLPSTVNIRLARHSIDQRVVGRWERISGWVASLTSADNAHTVSENGPNPLAAAERALNAWRRSPAAPIRLRVRSVEVTPRPAA